MNRGSTGGARAIPAVVGMLYVSLAGYVVAQYTGVVSAAILVVSVSTLATVVTFGGLTFVKAQAVSAFIRMSAGREGEWVPGYAKQLSTFSDKEIDEITRRILLRADVSPERMDGVREFLAGRMEHAGDDRATRLEALINGLADEVNSRRR